MARKRANIAATSTHASSSRKKGRKAEELDNTRFRHLDSQRRFNAALFDRECIPEKKILLATGFYRQFVEEIERRQWTKLLEDPPVAFKPVVREFYANLLVKNKAGYPPGCVYVRGKWIDNVSSAVNRFLRAPLNSSHKYGELVKRDDLNWEEVKSVIGVTGSVWTYRRNNYIRPKGLPNRYLNRNARVWSQIMFSRLLPNSHTSNATTEQCVLLYCLMEKKEINLGELITEHMRTIPTRNASLPYPSLVTAMALQKGVVIDPDEEKVEGQPPICDDAMHTSIQKNQRKLKQDRNTCAAAGGQGAPHQELPPHRAATPPPADPDFLQLQGQIDLLRIDMRQAISFLYSGMQQLDSRLSALMAQQLSPEAIAQLPSLPPMDPQLFAPRNTLSNIDAEEKSDEETDEASESKSD